MQIKRKGKKGKKKEKEIKDIEAIRWLDDKFHRFSETGQNKADKVIESVCTPGNPILRETMLKGRNECREKKVWMVVWIAKWEGDEKALVAGKRVYWA